MHSKVSGPAGGSCLGARCCAVVPCMLRLLSLPRTAPAHKTACATGALILREPTRGSLTALCEVVYSVQTPQYPRSRQHGPRDTGAGAWKGRLPARLHAGRHCGAAAGRRARQGGRGRARGSAARRHARLARCGSAASMQQRLTPAAASGRLIALCPAARPQVRAAREETIQTLKRDTLGVMRGAQVRMLACLLATAAARHARPQNCAGLQHASRAQARPPPLSLPLHNTRHAHATPPPSGPPAWRSPSASTCLPSPAAASQT